MKYNEVNKMSNKELETKLNKIKKDLFNIRFKKINGQIDDTSKSSILKKDVAKILTMQKKLSKKTK
jgi:large subunit ribosomal protein L29